MKKALRDQVLQARQGQSPAVVAAKSRWIREQLRRLPVFQKAGTIMVYVDFRQEVATRPLIRRLLREGKQVAVPVCREAGRLIPAAIKAFPGDLRPGKWGILEPPEDHLDSVDPGELDLVLVPGVAFDRRGNRLGYGAGYYDRFLPLLRPGASKIGLAFALQLVEDVFPGAHDVPVDCIVTETEVIKRG
ncbi:MAG: 5-formyltetrahydrofolate cyclo-ligase [Heliobacteriaceae bacterium]|nr:5-formyltetrahydrofolate cyclo-ligase [Heliobacteriaceae bacterium]MDD4588164.1 5-formyltetrahydrofolate cyclo-ligase [Heliobacteriaceae bacterium]